MKKNEYFKEIEKIYKEKKSDFKKDFKNLEILGIMEQIKIYI